MGWDRVRIFDGFDGESTLVSADKTAHGTLLSDSFKRFARECGFAVRVVIDENDPAGKHADALQQHHAQPITLPDSAKEKEPWLDRELVMQPLLEFRPPLNEPMTSMLCVFFKVFCESTDAGMVIDHRNQTPTQIAEW